MEPLSNQLPHDIVPQDVSLPAGEYDPFAHHFPPEGMTLEYMIEWLHFDGDRLRRDLAEGKIPGVDSKTTRFDRATVDRICDFYDSDFDDLGDWTKAFRGRDPKEVDEIRRELEEGGDFPLDY